MQIEKKIEVAVPVSAAYNQWTQFEEFPQFMEGVKSVEQLSDERLHWVAEVAGKQKEWYARITRQVPDEVMAWVSESGATNNGTVIFHSLENGHTEVELHLEAEPDGLQEQVGGALGFLGRQVEADLERFKAYIEGRAGNETGAWRGEIAHGQDTPGASRAQEPDEVRHAEALGTSIQSASKRPSLPSYGGSDTSPPGTGFGL